MSEVAYLLSTDAIRAKAERILEMNLQGEGQFYVDLARLPEVANLVVNQIREKYPRLQIPYHSRFGHFRVGHRDRISELLEKIKSQDQIEQSRILIDLVVVSVLLDAGAGPDWSYRDERGQVFSRSEGLAVASYELFLKGTFSSQPKTKPLMADAEGLMQITEETIAQGFQVSVSNPLLGTKGRAELLFRLGKSLNGKLRRPGGLLDLCLAESPDRKIRAHRVLDFVLRELGPIWPGRIIMNDVNLGDCWRHEDLGLGPESFVPFHKLSQWLTYSLLEPLEHAGFQVTNLNQLTGLAEYRNGGLMIDGGLITPKDGQAFERPWPPDSKLVIEWRALTIVLLDRLAPLIREALRKTEDEFPLVKVLEGGTWWTGRKLAQGARSGRPPIEIVSDGTVF